MALAARSRSRATMPSSAASSCTARAVAPPACLQLPDRRDQRGITVMGFIPSVGEAGAENEVGHEIDRQRIELTTSLREHCLRNSISEIVVAMDDSRWGIPFNAFLECRLAGIQVTDLTAFLERETRQDPRRPRAPELDDLRAGLQPQFPRRPTGARRRCASEHGPCYSPHGR